MFRLPFSLPPIPRIVAIVALVLGVAGMFVFDQSDSPVWLLESGQETGVILKFEESRGLLYDTYEGILDTEEGVFEFSANDSAVVSDIRKYGDDTLIISYEQYRFVPSSLGSSNNIAVAVDTL